MFGRSVARAMARALYEIGASTALTRAWTSAAAGSTAAAVLE